MILNKAQIADVLRQAGFPEFLIPVMSAIGLAESSGDTGAYRVRAAGQGQRLPETSVGLFQINLLAHPEYRGVNLTDPLTNAKAALAVYYKQGLRAWGSYVDGRYRQYFNGSAPAPSGYQAISNPTSNDYKNYLGLNLIGDKNRYLIAFIILVIIFVFAFN